MSALVRTSLAALQAAVLWSWTVVWISVALSAYLLTRRRTISLALARSVWAPFVLRVVGARSSVVGLDAIDARGSQLFVVNHASLLDIPVLFATLPLPVRFLAKAELRNVPFLGRYIAAMGMVFIHRQDSEAARQSIEQVAGVLRSGASLVAFPEGTRSRSGEIQSFKTGVFVAAIKAAVPVVPIRILGSAAVLPPDGFAPRPGAVRVILGEPIPTSGLKEEDRRTLAEKARAEVVALAADGRGRRSEGQSERVASSRT